MKEKAESLNSENIKLLSALQAERSRVSKLEGCVCDLQDSATQTLVHSTCSVGTFTDNVTQVTSYTSYSQFYFLFSIILPALNSTSCSQFYFLLSIILPALNSTSYFQFYFLLSILCPTLNSTSCSQFFFLFSIILPALDSTAYS